MERKLTFLIRTLPVVFLLHNIEEVMTMQQWENVNPGFIPNPATTAQFAIAVGIFSLCGFILTYTRPLYKIEKNFFYLIAGFSGMLLLNVFIPHLIGALYLGTYTPGLITALLLNLPLSLSILRLLYTLRKLNMKQFILSVISEGIIGALLAYLLLELGKALV